MSAAYRPNTLSHAPYDEDLALKRFATAPEDTKPRFDWRGLVAEDQLFASERVPRSVKVMAGGEVVDFDLAEVADVVGAALTNLLLSRDQDEEAIYTDKNREFVTLVATAVADNLAARAKEGKALTLSEREI